MGLTRPYGRPWEATGRPRGHRMLREATGATGARSNIPLWGSPLGGPFLVDCCLPVCFCMYLLTLLSLLSLLLAIFIHNQMVDPVPGVLLLLHFPSFPFHDSTGFRFCYKTYEKPYIVASIQVPEWALWRALWEAPLGPLWEPLGRSSGASLGAFRGSKNTEVIR